MLRRGTRIGIGDKAKEVKAMYVGIGGLAKKVVRAYVGINGKAVPIWPPIDPDKPITGHTFTVTFEALSGNKVVTGVWNEAQKRIEF